MDGVKASRRKFVLATYQVIIGAMDMNSRPLAVRQMPSMSGCSSNLSHVCLEYKA